MQPDIVLYAGPGPAIADALMGGPPNAVFVGWGSRELSQLEKWHGRRRMEGEDTARMTAG